jgi:hypothetical protein
VPLSSPHSPRPCVDSSALGGEAEAPPPPLLPPPPLSSSSPRVVAVEESKQQQQQQQQQPRRRRTKPLPPQIALDDHHHHNHFGLRTLTLGIMRLTLRGRHRRPATNPTPTLSRHDILLNGAVEDGVCVPLPVSSALSPEGLSRSEGGGPSSALSVAAAAAVAGILMGVEGGGGEYSDSNSSSINSMKKGLAATVAGTGRVGAGGGRRPRPLAISAVDAHHYNVSTILPGRLLIGGEDVGGSVATLRRLGVKGVVNATRDGPVEEGGAAAGAGGAAGGEGGGEALWPLAVGCWRLWVWVSVCVWIVEGRKDPIRLWACVSAC